MKYLGKIRKVINNKTFKYSVIILIQVILIFTLSQLMLAVKVYKVSGKSMEPTLSAGKVVIIDRKPKQILRGDIVVFPLEGSVSQKEFIIKRVVAVGGDIIRYVEGNLMVNGKKIDMYSSPQLNKSLTDVEFILKPDQFWLLSDNMEIDTVDSRRLGVLKRTEITGTLIYPKGL